MKILNENDEEILEVKLKNEINDPLINSKYLEKDKKEAYKIDQNFNNIEEIITNNYDEYQINKTD